MKGGELREIRSLKKVKDETKVRDESLSKPSYEQDKNHPLGVIVMTG